jgi:histidyl-tRNA synthetase
LLGGPRAPATGFAIGEDRLVLALQAQAKAVATLPVAYIIPIGAGMNRHALKLARELRRNGLIVDVGDESFRVKKGFEAAEKLGAKYAIIVGENEVNSGTFAMKDLNSGEQYPVARGELEDSLRRPQGAPRSPALG